MVVSASWFLRTDGLEGWKESDARHSGEFFNSFQKLVILCCLYFVLFGPYPSPLRALHSGIIPSEVWGTPYGVLGTELCSTTYKQVPHPLYYSSEPAPF